MTNITRFKCLTLMITLCLSCSTCYGSVKDRLSTIKIHEMSYLDEIGFLGCDSPVPGGCLNKGELLVIEHLIKDNDTVFDAGANLGEWSTSVFNHTSQVTIHAFEPVPAIYKSLYERLSSNPNIKLHQIALFSSKGELEFAYYPDLSGLSTLFERKSVDWLKLNPTFIKVKTERLSDFCKDNSISHIDFLKIDTEGSEADIFFGAFEMLNSHSIDFIQFEYGGCFIDAKTTLKTIYDILAKTNYSLYKIAHFGLIEISRWDDRLENYDWSNFLAVKKVN